MVLDLFSSIPTEPVNSRWTSARTGMPSIHLQVLKVLRRFYVMQFLRHINYKCKFKNASDINEVTPQKKFVLPKHKIIIIKKQKKTYYRLIEGHKIVEMNGWTDGWMDRDGWMYRWMDSVSYVIGLYLTSTICS